MRRRFGPRLARARRATTGAADGQALTAIVVGVASPEGSPEPCVSRVRPGTNHVGAKRARPFGR